MALKETLKRQSSTTDLWGGPLWRRLLVALLGVLLLGAWYLVVEHWLG